MNEPIIRFENVSKRFRLYHQRHYSLKENVLTLFRDHGRWEEFWALKAIDLEVPAGQMLGIIGENGSGKSTCLKLLARILAPDTGTVTVRGSVSALIELGAGFQPDFTGRENVYLNGSILGFTKREIDERFDDIVRFAELERFIDTPVKTYSSGMYMRLGFAIATHVDPDVLLIDEILAVGDEPFQEKCLDRIRRFREAGKTIVFVSHALGAVEALCDRVILLSKGRLVADGPPRETIETYRRVLGMASHAQVLVPPLASLCPPSPPPEPDLRDQVRDLRARLDEVACRPVAQETIDRVNERLNRLDEAVTALMGQAQALSQELADLRARASSVPHDLAEKVAWLERRVSGPISIENARERLVHLEECMGVVHQQDTMRDRALNDLAARINQLEARIHTFFIEGTAVIPRRYGTREVEVTDVVFLDHEGKETRRFRSGNPLTIRIAYRSRGEPKDAVVGISFVDQRGGVVFGTNTKIDGVREKLGPAGIVEVTIKRIPLLAGLFYVGVSVHSPDETIHYHRLDNCFEIVVEPRRSFDGRVDMECRWRVAPSRE